MKAESHPILRAFCIPRGTAGAPQEPCCCGRGVHLTPRPHIPCPLPLAVHPEVCLLGRVLARPECPYLFLSEGTGTSRPRVRLHPSRRISLLSSHPLCACGDTQLSGTRAGLLLAPGNLRLLVASPGPLLLVQAVPLVHLPLADSDVPVQLNKVGVDLGLVTL